MHRPPLPSLKHYPHWVPEDDLLFLLMDNPNEVLKQQSEELTASWYLKYGRQKGIFQWDLKLLSAFCMMFVSLARFFQIPLSDTIRDVD